MELSSFSENIITATMERGGESLELQINIDAIVPDYFDVLTERLAPTQKRLDDAIAQNNQILAAIAKDEAERKAAAEAQKKGRKPKKQKPLDLKAFAEHLKSVQREVAEAKCEIYAEQLTCPVKLPDGSFTCVLKGWDLTENGMALAPTKENLMRLPLKALEALVAFVEKNLTTVKKNETSEEESSTKTQSTTSGGSMALRAV